MRRSVDKQRRPGVLAWFVESLKKDSMDPPLGSNRELAVRLMYFFAVVAVLLSGLLTLLGLLVPQVTEISLAYSAGWMVFTGLLVVFWERLPLSLLRATVILSLIAFLARWAVAWMALAAPEIPMAVFATMAYTPIVLIVLALLEGRRRGVLAGTVVTLVMSLTAIVSLERPEVQQVFVGDIRLALFVAALVWMYTYITYIMTTQQHELMIADMRSVLLTDGVNIDPMTGLLNRRGIDVAATTALSNRELRGVLLVDIDGFKSLRESLGYSVADDALRQVAECLSKTVRDHDIVGYWGGDQFLVLASGEDRATIEGCAQRLRRAVAAIENPKLPPLTASVGASQLTPLEAFDDIVHLAVSALLDAKKSGRNCVRSRWDPRADSGQPAT